MWGFFVIVPFMADNIEPHVIDTFDGIPMLQDLFAGPPFGTGLFTAALILAVMVIAVHRRNDARRIHDSAARSTRNRPTASAARPGK